MTQSLDKEQETAVRHKDGPFLCIAGPGSGKTTVIIHRVLSLVESGVEPGKVLVMTFSRKAAEELGKRYRSLPGSKPGPLFCTIHSFANRVRLYNVAWKELTVLGEADKRKLFKEILLSMGPECLTNSYDMDAAYREIGAEVSKYYLAVKEEREDFSSHAFVDQTRFFRFYQEYKTMKTERKQIDYDDMLMFCCEAFSRVPEVLDYFRSQFDYIMVDEFQDTTRIQYEIVRKLAAPKNNLFICGDDDQSIYGFNNAKPEIMLHFENDYPECGKAKLVTNYRSDQEVIRAAGNLIVHNTERFPKDITGVRQTPGKIEILPAREDSSVYDTTLNALLDENCSGTPFYKMAILTRTNREAKAFAAFCQRRNIPYYYPAGAMDLYSGCLWKVIECYLKAADGDDGWETLSYIINRPYRYIPKAEIANSNDLDGLLSRLKSRSPLPAKHLARFQMLLAEIRTFAKTAPDAGSVVSHIWKKAELDRWMKEYCRFTMEDESFMREKLFLISTEASRVSDTAEYLAEVEVQKQVFRQNLKNAARNKERGVTISTAHAAKGLEWNTVFISSCNQGIFPFMRVNEIIADKDLEEERRLMYVALTRAKNRCILVEDHGRMESQFLQEMSEENSHEK